jgi:hypothetical protein
MEKCYILQPIGIFKAKWYILWSFGIFYGHLVYFMVIWYILSGFGILFRDKSCNPGLLYYLKGLGQVARLHKAVHLVTPKYTF